MATYTRIPLSASANGLPVPVVATTSPGTTIHTAISSATAFDEIYLWASNVTSSSATLTVQWGGTTDPTNDIVFQFVVPANSPPIPISTGQFLNNGLVLKAYSGTASAINLTGFVNRIQ